MAAMSPHRPQDNRRARLLELAAAVGVTELPPLPPLPPIRLPTPSPQDDLQAEELLRQRRQAENPEASQSSLKRAFSSTKKPWEAKEIFDVLDNHVSKGGSPAVANVLIRKLLELGGSPNFKSSKGSRSSSILSRRKSMESLERSQILQKAIQNRQADMVSVLAHYADEQTLGMALPDAIRSKDITILGLLLQRGANIAPSQNGQIEFRQLCIVGGHPDLVGLILQSSGGMSSQHLSLCLIDASKRGDLQTVWRLSRSTADADFDTAEALRVAIGQSRVDIALAILTGRQPPTPGGAGLMESFRQLLNQSTGPNEKLFLTEALLCAGAPGDMVAVALQQACEAENLDMVHLLVENGASVEYQEAKVLCDTIARGNCNMLQLLLNDRTRLSPNLASRCVSVIPTTVNPETRYAFLNILLRKGAGGAALGDALIAAVRAGDVQSVDLLLTPYFPGDTVPSEARPRKGSLQMKHARHEVASVDHLNGMALNNAVMMVNIDMVKKLLTGKPTPATLELVFPQVKKLAPNERYLITEAFLAAGLTGPCLSVALTEAIEEQHPRRDDRFISLLLRYTEGTHSDNDSGILSSIAVGDVPLLRKMLKRPLTPQTSAAAMAKVMGINNQEVRYAIVELLLQAGAGRDGDEVSAALAQVLTTQPLDVQLFSLLLKLGNVDANFRNGEPVTLAVRNPDPAILELVIQYGKPTSETVKASLDSLSKMLTPGKPAKYSLLLRHTKEQEHLNMLLFTEVQTTLQAPLDTRNYGAVEVLLSAGADVNYHRAAAFCTAVKAPSAPLTDQMLRLKPTPESLAEALKYALNIVIPNDRLDFTRKLVEAGAPASEVNRALNYALQTHASDYQLFELLATYADSTDGTALGRAVDKQDARAVELILAKSSRKYPPAVLNTAFATAIKLKDPEICASLLKRGVSGSDISSALIAAAADGNLTLVNLLMGHGASLEHQEGQAIVEACKSAAIPVLNALLRPTAQVKKQTLVKGFEAASVSVTELKDRTEVFRILLERGGVDGEVVDRQLVAAGTYGDEGGGEALVRLLLAYGADPDFNSGEGIWNATRGAALKSLNLMLGVEKTNDRQKTPSQDVLLKSLKAGRKLNRDARYQVTEWLFAAGLEPSEDVHTSLHRAVKEQEPDVRLIKLLLAHGASPLMNGCETLIDAAQSFQVEVLEALLAVDIPGKDISWAFQHAFTPETVESWMTEQGFQVAQMLLEKAGAEGGGNGEALFPALNAAVDAYGTEKEALARQFATLLLQHGASVTCEDGLVLQKAAQKADSELIQLILEQNPDSSSVSLAFPCLFDADLSEEEILVLIELFICYNYEGERLDVMAPTDPPILLRALGKYPRSERLLQTLLDAGYYHDPLTTMRVMEDGEEEQVNLLFWALSQPQKRISSKPIELLINRGAKVNFETRVSKRTPLMVAIEHRRLDLVKALLLAGADADVVDAEENTPMSLATSIGGDIGTDMMTLLLVADPQAAINDGSLHNAARKLNLEAVQRLIQHGHDPDFPSVVHGGRSALGELCLNAAEAGPLSASQEKKMEKVIAELIKSGTNLAEKQADGKSVLHLALHSTDPLPITRALLKAGVWKTINSADHQWTDGVYTYSPTQYLVRVIPPNSRDRTALLELLRSYRCRDVYYANDGPQPEGAVNLPPELLRAERERRARAERIAKETEEHQIAIARTKEIASMQNKIFQARAELEDSRIRRQRDEEIEAVRSRQAVEEEGFAAELARRKAEREASMKHERQLLEAGLTRARLVSEAELEMEERKQGQTKQWEAQRLQAAKQLSEVRVQERREMERIEAASDARMVKRLGEHKKLVESQERLARSLNGAVPAGANGRRQVGYITGELD
ncbi:hypothetical protein B0T20DRAFT_180363 [Sordaria brevicollis]|uniref:Ankyrin repeat containing protein n=1 Tax=Sordaria brevicollis TaxID=83679 RepID=A0AAE0UDJ2_SORBR|nr:hypothetical protein B0T20DRAFT_180363 [Sordaria brevicollis]